MSTTTSIPSTRTLRQEIRRFLAAAMERSESDTERRRRGQRRYHRSWPLLVRLDDPGESTDLSVALHNASEHGVAFLADEPFAIGCRVLVRLFWHEDDSPRVPAIIRHATPVAHGYLVGCEFALLEHHGSSEDAQVTTMTPD